MIGVDIITVQVITYKKLKSGEIVISSQDGNQNWVSLFATICVVVITVLSTLIYQGELKDLKNTWVDNISQDIVYFVAILTK